MRYIKSFLINLAFSCLSLTALASSGAALYVQLRNGITDKFVLVEKPVVTFDGQHVSIKSSVMTVDSAYVYADVEKFYFDVVQDDYIGPEPPGPGDAIDDLQKDGKEKVGFEFAYDGRYAQIKGLAAKEQVAVFSIDGKRMQPKTVVSPSAVTISMFELPSGVYIIRTANRSIKIIRK